jgi:nitrate/nitrite transporter NarK
MSAVSVAPRTLQRAWALLCLMLAGEAIFSLPFHVARFFRPTLLEAFGLSNAALGDAFAVYGVTAMLCYFPGGMLADRWHARGLMTLALVATAAGGLYLASFPPASGLKLLYGYWGVTTILPFWAALIRATREWGGAPAQGRAFGLLDAGRGLVAAGVAGIAVSLLGLGADTQAVLAAGRVEHLRHVILFYTAVTLAAALICWWVIPASTAHAAPRVPHHLRAQLRAALRLPLVWRQAAIVVAAYCGYKGIDNYALYAVQVCGMGEIEAARFVANAAWLRPVAALLAGLLADRFRASASLAVLFVLAALSYVYLGLADGEASLRGIIVANLALSVAAVYGLRGVYFAAMEEARVPVQHTGGAVGLISVVGYTPDIFFAPIAGRLLDASPGLAGHQHYFLLLAGIAAVGVVCSFSLYRRLTRDAPSAR